MPCARLIACLLLALSCALASAQEEALPEELGKLSPDRVNQLQATLAAPTPTDVLNRTLTQHFLAKEAAALQLGDLPATLALYREWQARLPSTLPQNNYANALMRAGEFDEALRLRKALVDNVKPRIHQEMLRRNLAETLLDTGHIEEAQQTLEVLQNKLRAYNQQGLLDRDLVMLRRIEAGTQRLASVMALRSGMLTLALDQARAAVASGRLGLQLAQALPERSQQAMDVAWASSNLAEALAQLAACLQEAGQPEAAEDTLREQLRLAREMDLEPRQIGSIYSTAGRLRLATRRFVQAERHFRKADDVFASLGTPPLSKARINVAQWLIMSLAGQRRWADALGELDRLDGQAQSDPALRTRVQLPLARGYVYLGSGTRTAEAAQIFQDQHEALAKRYPAHHVEVAQAAGLQGVALWRLAQAQDKARAVGLLKASVADHMLPDNISLASTGLRKDIRELIFNTYLEAIWATPGENPMDTMVPADWVHAGPVQEALTDSAVRTAVGDPALATLVRADQDTRHQIQALRKYLAGDGEGLAAPEPQAAAQMRARLTELDALKQRLQSQLQSQFPDYTLLVNPTPASPAMLSQALMPDEALVLLLPTDEAVYVWALGHTGSGAWARVAMTLPQLTTKVQALRKTLDFNAMDGRLRPFQAQLASELYTQLLAPVSRVTQGKQHLIIAAGGPLAQIPFAVLLTRPTATLSPDAPWLIRQAALSYVPSLGAWTALRRLAQASPAPEPFAGWGDPLFKRMANMPATAASPSGGDRDRPAQRAAQSTDLDSPATDSTVRYGDMPPLPDTRDELMAIANSLQADPQHDLHLGEMATKASVLHSSQTGELLKKRVIAFATHGLMAGDLPRLNQPALALAGTGDEAEHPLNALLTLDDVLGLKLHADWVVLSACNTAAADGQAGEALSGLARGFFYAGAHSLLVTHWSVESDSAKRLTTATFVHYTQHAQARKAESLRQAMLGLQATPRFAHPAYWAPFALVGDGER